MNKKPTGYEPQAAPDATGDSAQPRRRTRMIPADQVEIQVNIQMPNGLKWAVEDYQAANDIPTKREAFIELLKAGLSAKAAKQAL